VITWRVPAAVAVLLAVVGSGFYVAARPYLPKHPNDGIRMPDHRPSNAHWVWPDGVPGWKPGERYKGFDVSFVQPVEVQAAQLAAARKGLDAGDVRVLATFRPGYRGIFAILAAPTRDMTPEKTCLAAVRLDAPVIWDCPAKHHLSHKHVYGVVAVQRWPDGRRSVTLVGVARGDVDRVEFGGGNVYVRAKTWGEFSGGWVSNPQTKQLLVFGHGRLLERIPVDLEPGQSAIIG
jgi:hypothetical protein